MSLVPRTLRFFLLAAMLPVAARAVDLRLDTGDFVFTRKPPQIVPELPIDTSRESVESAETPRYQIWADLDDVRPGVKFNYFHYILYVRDKTTGAVTRFTFSGQGRGTFEDQIVPVDFSVGEEQQWEEGTIDLPVFSATPMNALRGPKYEIDQPVEVYLASETPIELALTNELKKTPVDIVGVRSVSLSDPEMWEIPGPQDPGAKVAPFQLAPGATATNNLVLRVKPVTAKAFATALFPSRTRKAHDRITVQVDYTTRGRTPQPFAITVPVQFVPWPPTLLLVTAAGAVFGWLVLLVTEKARRRKWRDRLRDLAAGAAAGVLVEAIGMVLVAAESEFKILGLRFDPFQMLQAALIGVLAGMTGRQTLNMIRKNRWWAPPAAGPDDD